MKVLWFLLPPLLFLSAGAVPALAGAENPTASAEGKVVDEAGRPFQGARIELHLIEPEPDLSHADSGLYQATSGPDGLFRISGLPADSWFTLRIARRAFTVLVQRGIASSPEGGKVVLGTFRLPKGQTVAGRVVDSKGHPLAGAQVWALSEKDNELMEHRSWHAADGPAAVTGPDGRYEIHGFEPGSLRGLPGRILSERSLCRILAPEPGRSAPFSSSQPDHRTGGRRPRPTHHKGKNSTEL